MKFSVLALSLVATTVAAQSLPPTSRTVYRCEDGNKVHYSDAPCLGAKKVDVEPTRGLNKSSGREQIGPDVRREKSNENMAQALRPVFGETPEQRATRHKRAKLPPSVKTECGRLDADIARLESSERDAKGLALKSVQQDLLTARTQSQKLRC